MEEKEILRKIEAYCAVAERSQADVRSKLVRWEVPADVVERLIEALEKEKFLDEERFCRAFIRDKCRFSKWGKMKIAQALQQKQVAPSVYAPLLDEEVDEDEYLGTLRSLLSAKGKEVRARSEYEKKAKLVRFALGRGFGMADISRCLDVPDENAGLA